MRRRSGATRRRWTGFRIPGKTTLGLAVVLGALLPLAEAPAGAQCDEVMIWAEQGQQEGRNYSPTEEIVLQSGGTGLFRIYIRGRGEVGNSTTSQIGHPWDFGLQGHDRPTVNRILRFQPQNQQQVGLGTVRFQVGEPGQTALGYRILDVGRRGLSAVSARCRVGYIHVRVVARGGGGSQLPTGPPGGQAPVAVTGSWSTEWGSLTLEQQGGTVRGYYSHQQGRIEGTLQGNVLTGTWSQGPSYQAPRDAGSFVLTFDGGRTFRGVWRHGYAGDWQGQWNGSR